jgi:hypothetical protein
VSIIVLDSSVNHQFQKETHALVIPLIHENVGLYHIVILIPGLVNTKKALVTGAHMIIHVCRNTVMLAQTRADFNTLLDGKFLF